MIGILAAISIVGFKRYQADTRDARRSSSVTSISEALEKYYDINGEYPSCSALSAAGTTVSQATLKGINQTTLIAPQASSTDTNSIKCTSAGNILSTSGVDFFEYQGDGSATCNGAGSCFQYTLKYRDEASGTIKSILSRRQIYFLASDAPVLTATPAGSSQVNLAWNTIAQAASYTVQYATNSSFTSNLLAQSVSGTSLSISGLTTGTTYYFRVQAVNGSILSNWSNIKSIVVNFTNIAWAEHTTPPTQYWTCAASSADGNKLIAGTRLSSAGYLYRSADGGATWTILSSAGNLGWGSVSSSADGTKLVAEGGTGIYTSIDSGTTWITQTSAGSRSWWGIASSADGTKLAASDGFGGYIYTSIDSGATWTVHTSVGTRNWRSISSSADGTKLAAVSVDGYVYTSVDSGTTWVSRTIPGVLPLWSVASSADGTALLVSASGSNYVYMSTDAGVTWNAITGPGLKNWRQVAMSTDGTKLTAEAWGDYIYTSVDAGVTWVAQISAGSRFWLALASSADGTKLFAPVGSGGYLYNAVYSP